MNKSLEALERYYSNLLYGNGGFDTDEEELEGLNAIKQDLERLEQLKKIFGDSHICEIQARFNEIECTAENCNYCPLGFESGICLKNTFKKKWELQQENQDLSQIMQLNNEYIAGVERVKTDLVNENQKLKNAIEILKNHLHVKELDIDYVLDFNGLYDDHLTQQEYKLLNEVLGDDKRN